LNGAVDLIVERHRFLTVMAGAGPSLIQKLGAASAAPGAGTVPDAMPDVAGIVIAVPGLTSSEVG